MPAASRGPAELPRLAGEKELGTYVEDEYEIYLIAGIAGAGKSELLAAFPQSGYLQRFRRVDGQVLRTAQGELKVYPLSADGRNVVFVDASGERFRELYPHERETGEIAAVDVEFLRTLTPRLRGLILLVDLERLWGERFWTEYAANAKQIEILEWILTLVRWLTFDGRYDPARPVSFQDQVDASVRRMQRRLQVPVQVLFSKADRLVDLQPPSARGAGWLRAGETPQRRLYPAGEMPFFFTYHHLRRLLNAVATHAHHFRFDFVHALETDAVGKAVVDERNCGVSSALAWLLDPCWQRRPRPVPTRFWIALQRGVDRLRGRGERWRRLPPPLEVRP